MRSYVLTEHFGANLFGSGDSVSSSDFCPWCSDSASNQPQVTGLITLQNIAESLEQLVVEYTDRIEQETSDRQSD
ncbi:hypothetical protein H6F95_00615 [Cyanobacteria bacterium FACHB-471]|nr:hypothetical protein [Cyanobacteria bacterium FACHB-471]